MDITLPSPFQFAQRQPSFEAGGCEQGRSSSPHRVVGFLSSSLSSSTSSSSAFQEPSSPHSSGRLPNLSRQSSLGQQLRQQQQLQQPLPAMRGLCIKTKASGGSRGLQPARLGRARSMLPAAGPTAAAPAAASELLPCDATLPSGGGVAAMTRALTRQQSSNMEIPK